MSIDWITYILILLALAGTVLIIVGGFQYIRLDIESGIANMTVGMYLVLLAASGGSARYFWSFKLYSYCVPETVAFFLAFVHGIEFLRKNYEDAGRDGIAILVLTALPWVADATYWRFVS